MQLIALLMVLLITGFISVLVLEHVCHHRIKCCIRYLLSGLMFDLLILVNMLFGLRFIKGVKYFTDLWADLNCLSFFTKFAILSIIIAIILGVIFGILCRCMKKKHWCGCGFKDED